MVAKQNSQQKDSTATGASFASRRAKILVTMLGTDFAKSTQHPFFSRLVELATDETSADLPQPQDPGLNAALRALVTRLETDKTAIQPDKPEPTAAPAGPNTGAALPPAETLAADLTQLRNQHPAVIAYSAQKLSDEDCAAFLKSLPGSTARQVISILGIC